jgi:hypothetical protein
MSGSNFNPVADFVGTFVKYVEQRRAIAGMKRAERERAAYEARVERQQAEWRAEVESQKMHGDAGDATLSDAIAALGGRGIERDGGFS